MLPFPNRFYPASSQTFADSPSIRDFKRKESLRIAQDVETYLASGGTIQKVPYGATSLQYGMPLDNDALEVAMSPPTLQGSAKHNPEIMRQRALRRPRRGGRVVDAPF